LPWWIAGAAMFVLIVIVGVSMVGPAGPVAPTTGPAGGASIGGQPPDLSAMSPREAADRLYTRVMMAAEEGDSLEAQQFMPMAIAAYERAMPLDHDGLFHLSLLQRTAGDFETALLTAEGILDQDPDYILGLLAAAQAATELGRDDQATAHYEHLIAVFDAQVARALPEYEMHAPIMTSARNDAEAFLGR
jgi:tetratricopeptide (TPR) repeat protein